jgi:proteic killer suppression protein
MEEILACIVPSFRVLSVLMIKRVILSRRAKKDLRKIPGHVVRLLQDWVEDVEDRGLEEVRKVPGYHDEPLRGDRAGQRSIRLTRAYRAFYRIVSDQVVFVLVEEVNKHVY